MNNLVLSRVTPERLQDFARFCCLRQRIDYERRARKPITVQDDVLVFNRFPVIFRFTTPRIQYFLRHRFPIDTPQEREVWLTALFLCEALYYPTDFDSSRLRIGWNGVADEFIFSSLTDNLRQQKDYQYTPIFAMGRARRGYIRRIVESLAAIFKPSRVVPIDDDDDDDTPISYTVCERLFAARKTSEIWDILFDHVQGHDHFKALLMYDLSYLLPQSVEVDFLYTPYRALCGMRRFFGAIEREDVLAILKKVRDCFSDACKQCGEAFLVPWKEEVPLQLWDFLYAFQSYDWYKTIHESHAVGTHFSPYQEAFPPLYIPKKLK